jgi:GNAT superfamily N-acetyltransferase
MAESMTGAAVRMARPADVAEVVRVTNVAYEVESFFIDGERTDEAEVRVLIAQPQSAFLVIDDPASPGRLLASVYVETRGDRGYFAMLAVDPAHQGTGLARRLIGAVEDHCRAAGCRHLDFDMINLRTELPAFYARFGFVRAGTAEMGDRHKLKLECYRIKMSKPLLP